jgi:hypothetical protein
MDVNKFKVQLLQVSDKDLVTIRRLVMQEDNRRTMIRKGEPKPKRTPKSDTAYQELAEFIINGGRKRTKAEK